MKAQRNITSTNDGWQRQGQIVKALYLGSKECIGEIVDSRVALGGKVKHSLKLHFRLELDWRRVGTDFKFYEVGEYVGIDEENILEVLWISE